MSLFEFAETVRYASEDSEVPYLPIGAATLIDAVELFISRVITESADGDQILELMDWAVASKIAPLLDSGSASPDLIASFAESLQDFAGPTRRELLKIVAAGTHHID